MHSGFSKLVSIAPELSTLAISDLFKKIGMTLMSTVGGSSGALYGSAYIVASKMAVGKESLDLSGIAGMLDAMMNAIMARGNAQPGQKTMIDALYPAVQVLKNGMDSDVNELTVIEEMKAAALAGAASTVDMEAFRGRAFYQANKGMGHLDPGAVTMSYQLGALADFIIAKYS
jgi:dihydroxyacetone kinase-like protein